MKTKTTACGSGDGTPTSDNTTPDSTSTDIPNGETTDGETNSGDGSNGGSGDNNNGDSTTSENTENGEPAPVTNDGNTIRLGQLTASQIFAHSSMPIKESYRNKVCPRPGLDCRIKASYEAKH